MKRLFAILLFAAAATGGDELAVPTARYYPATGVAIFTEVDNVEILSLSSATASLSTAYHFPQGTPKGIFYDAGDVPFIANWIAFPTFPSVFNAGIVATPGTPVSDLTLAYIEQLPSQLLPGEVVLAPEPYSFTLAAVGVLAIMRRRAG